MLLDATVSPMEKKRYKNHLILTRLFSTNTLASVEQIYLFYCLINNKIYLTEHLADQFVYFNDRICLQPLTCNCINYQFHTTLPCQLYSAVHQLHAEYFRVKVQRIIFGDYLFYLFECTNIICIHGVQ